VWRQLCVMGRLVHTGLGSSSLVAHFLLYSPSPRERLCNRSCSNKHTQQRRFRSIRSRRFGTRDTDKDQCPLTVTLATEGEVCLNMNDAEEAHASDRSGRKGHSSFTTAAVWTSVIHAEENAIVAFGSIMGGSLT